jgi:uncharacterized protein (DUF433 family)
MKVLTKPTKLKPDNTLPAPFDNNLPDYSGNGHNIPLGYTTATAKAKTQTLGGDIFEIELSLDLSGNVTPSILETPEFNLDELVKGLCKKYPLITIDDEVIGEPRIAGTRFGVSDVLSAFCMYDSIDEIIAEYGNRYSEEQLRDAIRFARDFLDSFYINP